MWCCVTYYDTIQSSLRKDSHRKLFLQSDYVNLANPMKICREVNTQTRYTFVQRYILSWFLSENFSFHFNWITAHNKEVYNYFWRGSQMKRRSMKYFENFHLISVRDVRRQSVNILSPQRLQQKQSQNYIPTI